MYGDYGQFQTFPLTFGSAWYRYVGSSQGFYHTMVSLFGEDDGNRNTMIPAHTVGIGMPSASPGGACIQIYTAEYYAYYGGLVLYGGIADANGDGDRNDYYYNTVFCPDEVGGGGNWIVEPTSKFAKGQYRDPIPAINMGYVYYSADGNAGGLVIMPYFWLEYYQHDDANGNLIANEFIYFHTYYWIQLTKPDFEFVPGSLDWVFTGDVQPGGTVVGTFKLLNTGGIAIKIKEDGGVENDKGFKHQGLSAKDQIGPDGTIEPQETATFFFALTVSAGSPIGPLDVKIIVSYGGVTKEEVVTLPIILKMFGDDQSCYRHRQNALRTLRAFDMDDDDGMLHNLEPGDLVSVGGALMAPEDAILLLISWFENGCGGGDDVEQKAMRVTETVD
jgi:hypothetical protein